MRYLRDQILGLMRKSAYRPMSMRELIRHFDIPRGKRDQFEAVIVELTAAGDIILIKGKNYGLARKMNLVPGRITVHPDGFGFVIPEDDEGGDIYVRERNLDSAMHGDKVVVRLEPPSREGRREGSIVRILERANTTVVGAYEQFSTYGYLKPFDPHLTMDIYIPARASLGAQTGQMAVAEIVSYSSRQRTPEGKIVEILGEAGDQGVDESVVIREHGLPHAFPAETVTEARTVPTEVTAEQRRGRTDLRDLFTVTIDGENARDFDDAISIEFSRKGTYELWVHIADVSHYVREGSALDREALDRATSVYFPGMVIPMLPEELSNGICSLNPRVERLAFSVFMEIDGQGKVLRSDFAETVIRSDARMTYTLVREILAGITPPPPEIPGAAAVFRLMEELALKLRAARMRTGSIDFDLPEAEVVLDLQGRIQDIFRSERHIAHRIVEEFMLLANATVATHMARLELPFVYRIHEEPDPVKIDFFRRFTAGFGYVIPPGKIKPRHLSRLVAEMEGKKEAPVINNLLLRSMKQAVYSAQNVGHFGLAFDCYTHFTSPIRRYPDLVVHRLLRMVLKSGRYPGKREEELAASLPTVAQHCSARERRAMEAEREIVLLKKIRFMQEKVGEEQDGFITGVATFGFFVELAEFMVEGLVHISSLTDDYYLFDENTQSLLGDHTRRAFKVGDRVRVRVEKVSLERKQVDFGLLTHEGREQKKPVKGAKRPPAGRRKKR